MKILQVAFLLLFNYLDSLPKLCNKSAYEFVETSNLYFQRVFSCVLHDPYLNLTCNDLIITLRRCSIVTEYHVLREKYVIMQPCKVNVMMLLFLSEDP